MWAATSKNIEMVHMLAENGANLMKPKKDGLTIMHIAASINDIHVLDYVL